jgi:cytochrome c2
VTRLALGAGGAILLAACASLAQTADTDTLAQDTLAQGGRAYQRCYACHALSARETGADGPHLAAIVGRPVAALEGYPYSEALRAYGADGKVWTRERLDAFIADPHEEVPDNAMGFFGLDDPDERAALVEYLAQPR